MFCQLAFYSLKLHWIYLYIFNELSPLQISLQLIQIQIYMTDTIHRKALSNNPLKNNIISNANHKNKSQNQKRFSNISKQKQTVQKNTARYYEQIDMQGSATILPQKNSSRQNIYSNQNANHNVQITTNQKKQIVQQVMNVRSKSPIDKNRFNMQGNSQSSKTINNLKVATKSNDGFAKLLSQNKTQRSQKQGFKIKSMILNQQLNLHHGPQNVEDLICDQQLDIEPLSHQNKKLSNTKIISRTQSKSILQENNLSVLENKSEINRTQKKMPNDKTSLMIQKTKSEHNLTIKQQSLCTNGFLKSNQNLQSQNSGTSNFSNLIQRQSAKHNIHPLINLEQQLKKFLKIQSQINMNGQADTLMRLQNRQKQYMVQPNYIQVKQKHFNWFMRAILIDWMAHVCYQFALKRQTYYIALTIADKFLQKTNDLSKSQFQLVGAASMFIAAKLQQFQALSSNDFAKSTDNRYTANQIKQMEIKICKVLNYQLNPPTLYMWANRFMVHWDNYIELTNAKVHPFFNTHKHKYFKRDSQQSYLLYRQMMQFLDCSILDTQTLQFSPKILVCSFLYLILGKNYNQWPVKRIVEQFPRTSHYLISQDQISQFNHLFYMFLSDSFGIHISQLLPAVQYCSSYFTLPLNFDPPSYQSRDQNGQQTEINLEQYESFQTYNGKMIEIVKRRFRGVYL